jgi:hypothetical protein
MDTLLVFMWVSTSIAMACSVYLLKVCIEELVRTSRAMARIIPVIVVTFHEQEDTDEGQQQQQQ